MYGFNIRQVIDNMKMKGGEVATWQVGVNNHAWNGEWVSGEEKKVQNLISLLSMWIWKLLRL